MSTCSHKAIVYSALHTGTWFAVDLLTEVSKEEADCREDKWIQHSDQTTIEEMSFPDGVTNKWIDNLLYQKDLQNDGLLPHIELLVLQAHQRKDSNLYQSLLTTKPEIPVIVPFRDPLLSINTRAWRECGSIENFLAQPIEDRKTRVRDQLASIIRLLRLPPEHIYILPIDLVRTENNRINTFKDVIKYAKLTSNERLVEQAKAWKPKNQTQNGVFVQQAFHKKIKDKGFLRIKEAILTNDIESILDCFGEEIQLTHTMLAYFIPQLKELGYKNLCWW